MVVPPTSPDGSFDCYKGTVKEVNQDEVVLTNVLEESCIEYGANSRRRAPTQQKRDLVRVPLTGVDAIWALPPANGDAAPKPSTPNSPSSGAQPTPLPRAVPSATAEGSGSPRGADRSSPSPQLETTAHFDAPPAAGDVVR